MFRRSNAPSPPEDRPDAWKRSNVPSPFESTRNAVEPAVPVGSQAEQRAGAVQHATYPFPSMRALIDFHRELPLPEHHSAYFPTSFERTRIGLPISQGGNLADETSPKDRGCVDTNGNLIHPLPHPDPLSGFVAAESTVKPADDLGRLKTFIEGMTEAMADVMDNGRITGWFASTHRTWEQTVEVEILNSNGKLERQTLAVATVIERLSPKDAKRFRHDLIKVAMARMK